VSAEQLALIPQCEECLGVWMPAVARWQAQWIDDGPEERLLFYCPACARREFGATPNLRLLTAFYICEPGVRFAPWGAWAAQSRRRIGLALAFAITSHRWVLKYCGQESPVRG